MELKELLEDRFKVLNSEYSKQVSEVLKLRESLKNAEAQLQFLTGHLEEVKMLYNKYLETHFKEPVPKENKVDVKEFDKE